MQEGTDRAVRVRSLKYADDIATICPDCSQQSARITAIAAASFDMGTLRSDPDSLTRRVILSRGMDHQPGDLFSDAPLHSSIEELTSIANNREQQSQW